MRKSPSIYAIRMDLQVISVTNVIDDEVLKTIDVDLMNGNLLGVLWNFGSEEIEWYDEVVSQLIGLVSYNKNPR